MERYSLHRRRRKTALLEDTSSDSEATVDRAWLGSEPAVTKSKKIKARRHYTVGRELVLSLSCEPDRLISKLLALSKSAAGFSFGSLSLSGVQPESRLDSR